MLTLRRQTVIHRDGSVSVPVSSSSSPDHPEDTSLSFTMEPSSEPKMVSAHTMEASNEPAPEPSTDRFESQAVQGPPSRAPACISFAGAQFTLQDEDDGGTITYVSDDEAAKASVATLESMGLAGSWQQVGQVKINIRNSGPAGAAVSLRFQVPDGTTLLESSSALMSWGIEI